MLNQDTYSAKLEKMVVAKKFEEIAKTNENIYAIDFGSFKKFCNLEIVLMHFGNRLNAADFEEIKDTIINNNDNNMFSTKSQSKQLGLKTAAGALFKEE